MVSADGATCVPRRCQNTGGRFVCRKCPKDYISGASFMYYYDQLKKKFFSLCWLFFFNLQSFSKALRYLITFFFVALLRSSLNIFNIGYIEIGRIVSLTLLSLTTFLFKYIYLSYVLFV